MLYTVAVLTCSRIGTAFVSRHDMARAVYCPVCKQKMEAGHLKRKDMMAEAENLEAARKNIERILNIKPRLWQGYSGG